MKKKIVVRYGAVSAPRPLWWPDSKQRLVWTWPFILVLAMFNLFASTATYAQGSKLVGISSRVRCQTGEAAVVSEFVIQGGAAKKVLVRALGPSLAAGGTPLPGRLVDPTMELRDSAGTLLRTNDNWRELQEAEIQATGLAPSDNRESAIVATFPPGMYATIIRGTGNSTGVAVSEVYEVDASPSSFTALGTRGVVQTGDNVLISGVFLSGSQNQEVLVRALGPSLANSGLSGALEDPTLELRGSDGSLLGENDNWQTSQGTAIQNSGLAPSNNLESAIIATLPPGSYTSIIRGVDNTTGLGFVQYYALPYSGSALDPAVLALPVITSPLGASATVGQLFIYQFEASSATSLAVTNPPPGLAYNSLLRVIVGNPTASGTFQTGLSATNANGTTNATLTITVRQPPASGPTIISGTAATVRTGRFFNFQVITTGGGPATRLSASGLPPGVTADPVTGVISGTATLDGSFAVTLTVTDGNLTATSTLQLTVTSDPARPVIISPSSASLTPGQFFSYTIKTSPDSDPSDPIIFNLFGELPRELTFDAQTGTISGTFTGQFGHDGESPNRPTLSGGIITNVQFFANSSTFPFNIFEMLIGTVNLSTRINVGLGENVLIGGFIITGNAPKKVVLRAIGPSLKRTDGLPLPGRLQDPTLTLKEGQVVLGENNDWKDSQEQEIMDTTIAPADDKESAILAALNPGTYTAIVSGASVSREDPTGIALVEVYDLGTASTDVSSNSKLANISSRGTVRSGDSVMIGGFIISGGKTNIIVRAIGPSLAKAPHNIQEPLKDPFLELYSGNGDRMVGNDDWKKREDGSSQQVEIEGTTIPPSDDRECAILARPLPPGNYTAIVSGKNETGVAVVEAYVLP